MENKKIIYILADSANLDSPKDAKSGGKVRFFRGDNLDFKVSFFNAGVLRTPKESDTIFLEVLDVGSINLPSDEDTKLVMFAEISGASANINASEEDCKKFLEAHLTFSFNALDTRIDSGEKILRIYIVDEEGCRLTYAQGWVFVESDFCSGQSKSLDESGKFLTLKEAGDKFSDKNKNLSDIPDKSSARENLEVYSKSDLDAKLSSKSGAENKIVCALLPKGYFFNEVSSRYFDLDFFSLPITIFISALAFDDIFSLYTIGGSATFQISINNKVLRIYVGKLSSGYNTEFNLSNFDISKGGKFVISIGTLAGEIDAWFDCVSLEKITSAKNLDSGSFSQIGVAIDSPKNAIDRFMIAHQKTYLDEGHYSVRDFQNNKVYPNNACPDFIRNSNLGADIEGGWNLEHVEKGATKQMWTCENINIYLEDGTGTLYCKNSENPPDGLDYAVDLGFSHYDLNSIQQEIFGGFFMNPSAYPDGWNGLGYDGYKVKVKCKMKFLKEGTLFWIAGQRWTLSQQVITQEDIAKGWHEFTHEHIDTSDSMDISSVVCILPMNLEGESGPVISIADFTCDIEGLYFEYSDLHLLEGTKTLSPLNISGVFYDVNANNSSVFRKKFSRYGNIYWRPLEMTSISISSRFSSTFYLPRNGMILELWLKSHDGAINLNFGTSSNPQKYASNFSYPVGSAGMLKVAEFYFDENSALLLTPLTQKSSYRNITYMLIEK